jgi:4-hydroxybenzoyl-CoA thioesterase
MRRFVWPVTVGFGDCDPANIVYYPNFFRWFDQATHQMWRSAGYDIAQLRQQTGLIAGPLVDVGATFRATATHGDLIEVHSQVEEWTARTFRIAHQIRRGDTVLVDGFEVRIFARPDPDHPARIKTVPIPENFRALFSSEPVAD